MSPPSLEPPMTPTSAPSRWKKILWQRQPFPDNYVPDDFLSELGDLPARPQPLFFALVLAALPITQHISVIATFLAVFTSLLDGRVGAGTVGWGCVGLGGMGWGLWRWGWGRRGAVRHGDPLIPPPTTIRTLILPPLLLSLLSPILGTLTSATTSDSIWPLAAGLGLLHMLLADLGTGEDVRVVRRREKMRRRRGSVGWREVGEEKSLTSSLSLTSALSASVVLASRLPSTLHVFSLVLLAVLLFAGWPVIAKSVREAGSVFSFILTVSTTLLAVSLFPPPLPPSPLAPPSFPVLATLSTPTVILLSAILLANVVGPAMLWYAWGWKTRMGGGWDVAVVRVRQGRG